MVKHEMIFSINIIVTFLFEQQRPISQRGRKGYKGRGEIEIKNN